MFYLMSFIFLFILFSLGAKFLSFKYAYVFFCILFYVSNVVISFKESALFLGAYLFLLLLNLYFHRKLYFSSKFHLFAFLGFIFIPFLFLKIDGFLGVVLLIFLLNCFEISRHDVNDKGACFPSSFSISIIFSLIAVVLSVIKIDLEYSLLGGIIMLWFCFELSSLLNIDNQKFFKEPESPLLFSIFINGFIKPVFFFKLLHVSGLVLNGSALIFYLFSAFVFLSLLLLREILKKQIFSYYYLSFVINAFCLVVIFYIGGSKNENYFFIAHFLNVISFMTLKLSKTKFLKNVAEIVVFATPISPIFLFNLYNLKLAYMNGYNIQLILFFVLISFPIYLYSTKRREINV